MKHDVNAHAILGRVAAGEDVYTYDVHHTSLAALVRHRRVVVDAGCRLHLPARPLAAGDFCGHQNKFLDAWGCGVTPPDPELDANAVRDGERHG